MDGYHAHHIEDFDGDLDELMREFHNNTTNNNNNSHTGGGNQQHLMSGGGDIGANLFASKNLDVSFTYGSLPLNLAGGDVHLSENINELNISLSPDNSSHHLSSSMAAHVLGDPVDLLTTLTPPGGSSDDDEHLSMAPANQFVSQLPPEKRAIVKPSKSSVRAALLSTTSTVPNSSSLPFHLDAMRAAFAPASRLTPTALPFLPVVPPTTSIGTVDATVTTGHHHFRSVSMSSSGAFDLAANYGLLGRRENVRPKKYTSDYLMALVKEKAELQSLPKIFTHIERLIDDEIGKVQSSIGNLTLSNQPPLRLPRPEGEVVLLEEKIYIPVHDYPSYNFVGRILGPRGMTAKQLEQETGCKIMIRGKGSVRDRFKQEDTCRGRPNWEHLDDDLHVLIQCEDTENRAQIKMQRAVEEVKIMLVPAREGEDELKRKQLMELAIINGNYRPTNQRKIAIQTPRLLTPMTLTASLRTSTVTDNPFSLGASVNALLNGSCNDMDPEMMNHFSAFNLPWNMNAAM